MRGRNSRPHLDENTLHSTTSSVRANGIEIEYAESGARDAPVILLIMGLGMQLIAWPDAFCEGLAARGFRVVRFDNRDVGGSTKITSTKLVTLGRIALAAALARAVERKMPGRATSRWWKEEREGVFIDYNQNARDRTVASAYSVRAVPDARVSCPLQWDEVADIEAVLALGVDAVVTNRIGRLRSMLDSTRPDE